VARAEMDPEFLPMPDPNRSEARDDSGRLPKMRPAARLLILLRAGRRLGRGPLAVVVALACAAMALGMAAGSSHRPAKRPSGSAVSAQAGGTLPVAATAALKRVAERHGRARRAGAAYYRRIARKRVSTKAAAEFLPLYREAERVYGVTWRLIASIHRQETAFSTAASTYHGLNDFGCCAGPMQFNVTNGPVSTWKLYRQAFRAGRRPKRYPHRTRSHPSIYDDFDAIMAAGSLLSDSGAGRSLDSGAWSAAYSYYGHDLFGVTYASQVLARAEAWRRYGFCANCGLDEGLVAEFDDIYGAPVRRQLIAAERRRKKTKRHKLDRDRNADRRDRHSRRRRGDRDSTDRARRRLKRLLAKRDRPTRPSSPRPRRRRTRPTTPSPPPPPPTSTPPPPTTAPAPPGGCSPLQKLLGC
jgi:hypothetical protein